VRYISLCLCHRLWRGPAISGGEVLRSNPVYYSKKPRLLRSTSQRHLLSFVRCCLLPNYLLVENVITIPSLLSPTLLLQASLYSAKVERVVSLAPVRVMTSVSPCTAKV